MCNKRIITKINEAKTVCSLRSFGRCYLRKQTKWEKKRLWNFAVKEVDRSGILLKFYFFVHKFMLIRFLTLRWPHVCVCVCVHCQRSSGKGGWPTKTSMHFTKTYFRQRKKKKKWKMLVGLIKRYPKNSQTNDILECCKLCTDKNGCWLSMMRFGCEDGTWNVELKRCRHIDHTLLEYPVHVENRVLRMTFAATQTSSSHKHLNADVECVLLFMRNHISNKIRTDRGGRSFVHSFSRFNIIL